MKSRTTLASWAVAVTIVALLGGCPALRPAPQACVEEDQACGETGDCCEGLSCVDGRCEPEGTLQACVEEDQACGETGDCCEGLSCVDGRCEPEGTLTAQAALPAKTIALDLIGIHDPQSDRYDGNCIGCHGDRTNEVALDGVTPAAHSVMLNLFGAGNERCKTCHESGPDFLTRSAGGLREQVNMAQVGCTGCHAASATPAFYAK